MKEKISHIHYEMFASILSYPEEGMIEKIESVQELLNQNYPDAAEIMIEFTGFAKSVVYRKWEEIYTRTFDVQAITTLDMGYVLFGDDYKRGELLVNLSKEHTKAGNDCGTELADNLPNLLRLLNKVEDKDFENDLIYLIIKPALKKIISEFDIRNIDKKNKVYEKHHKTLIQIENNYGTVYQSLLKTLLNVLNKDFIESDKTPADENQYKPNFANKINLSD
jgi:nitrate reductase assembly molybdenum cofactor insertion protein NarJ